MRVIFFSPMVIFILVFFHNFFLGFPLKFSSSVQWVGLVFLYKRQVTFSLSFVLNYYEHILWLKTFCFKYIIYIFAAMQKRYTHILCMPSMYVQNCMWNCNRFFKITNVHCTNIHIGQWMSMKSRASQKNVSYVLQKSTSY